jgi:mitotic spindle assembly checkpoint protein MAD1
MNSPFEGRARGSNSTNYAFKSPGPARQLFPNNNNGNNRLQPTYNILTGSPAATPPARAPSAPPSSSNRTAVVKIDQSNEIIRGDLNSVRYELQTLREDRALEKVRHEQEIRELQAAVEEHARRADALESDKRFLFEKQKELADTLAKTKDEAATEKQELERQVRRMRNEKHELLEQVDEKAGEVEHLERQVKRVGEEWEARMKALMTKNQELEEDLRIKNKTTDELQSKLEAKDSEAQDLEMELLKVKAQTGDVETLKVLKKELSEQVNHIKTLETTNRRQAGELKTLRNEKRSLELVDEEKRSLEAKLKVMGELREELSSAQVQISVLQDERNAWQSYFQKEGLEFHSPESLARALVEERVEKAALVERAGRANPQLLEKEHVIQELEGEVRTLREELDKLKESSSKDAKARQRMERQKALALKEAQFLREQLKSYSTEEAMYNQGGFDEQKTQRIQELEGMLEAYKSEIEELKATVNALNGAATTASKKRPLEDEGGDERLGELMRRNRQLQDGK